MRWLHPARALFVLSALGLGYSSSVLLAFAGLFGPTWLNRISGSLLYGLVQPLVAIGLDQPADGLGLILVIFYAAGGVFGFGLLAFCFWSFTLEDAGVER